MNDRSEKLFNKEKSKKFDKIIANRNVNQSEAIVVITLLFLTYVPTNIIIFVWSSLVLQGFILIIIFPFEN